MDNNYLELLSTALRVQYEGRLDYYSSKKKPEDAYAYQILLETLDNPTTSEMCCLKSTDVKLIKAVGEGAYGRVYEGSVQNKKVAIKQVSASKGKPYSYLAEWRYPTLLQDCKYVVDVKAVFYDVDVFTVMELALGSLLNIDTTSVTNLTIYRFFCQMLNAIEFMQRYRIIHRDLKVENILVFPGNNFKVCDFGVAITLPPNQDELNFDKAGTYSSLPPEALKGIFSFSTDLYSLGVLLFYMHTGEHLIYTTVGDNAGFITGCETIHKLGRVKLFEQISNGRKVRRPQNDASGNYIRETLDQRVEEHMTFFKDIVLLLIKPDPKDRLTLKNAHLHDSMIIACAQFKGNNVDSDETDRIRLLEPAPLAALNGSQVMPLTNRLSTSPVLEDALALCNFVEENWLSKATKLPNITPKVEPVKVTDVTQMSETPRSPKLPKDISSAESEDDEDLESIGFRKRKLSTSLFSESSSSSSDSNKSNFENNAKSFSKKTSHKSNSSTEWVKPQTLHKGEKSVKGNSGEPSRSKKPADKKKQTQGAYPERFTCPKCKVNVSGPQNYARHRKICDGKRYVCKICGKSFTRSDTLKNHEKAKHENSVYQCNFCRQYYADRSALATHMKTCRKRIKEL